MRLDPNHIRQQIANLLLQFPELEEDEVLRADMIEGETEAFDFLRMVERQRQDAASLAGAIASNIAELGLRQERFERREKSMRALMFKIMEAADIKKAELPEATLSIRNGQQKLVGDAQPHEMPNEYVRTKLEIDRTAIKDTLKAGGIVPGFELSNAEPTLSIRTK
jgi:Gp157 protein